MKIEFDREVDGRWIAEIPEVGGFRGVMVYGKTKQEAEKKVRALALEVLSAGHEVERK